MRVADFDFHLPEDLIARYPTKERTASRLLRVLGNTGDLFHEHFMDVLAHVQAGDLMVFNDTRVIPARLFGEKSTGGKVEILVERIVSEAEAWVHLRANRAVKPGTELVFAGAKAQVQTRDDALFLLHFSLDTSLLDFLQQQGEMPLPPYMQRAPEALDAERYQTVYGNKDGAVAAPTAGLHFDEGLLQALRDKGVKMAFVTLHVGAGTFQPVRVEWLAEHVMHSEYIEVSAEVCETIKATKAEGGRVIAVGTTSMRCLESAALSGELQPFQGDTDIFIYPGFAFQVVDVLVTNFHLPKSTLLMLVCAFVGQETLLKAYHEAVKRCYRFFSYGDAMWLERKL